MGLALGCHPGLYARDPDIGELRSLVIPPNQSHAPSLAQPCNLVLSLSKHAWNSPPALRQAHVWTAPAVQEEFGVDAKWGASHVFGLLLRH